jgi:hypothetical protein
MISAQQLTDAQLIAFLNNPRVISLLTILAIWSIIWKGIALWKAARNGSKPWFAVMLLVNTVGLLEIIYIFYFSKKKA